MQAKDDGIHARNQDFIRYEQVETRQEYHLAEDAQEQFDEEFQIRTCDMRSPSFVQDLGDALREIGFAILDGHGVDARLYDEAEKNVLEMFSRLSLDDKMRFRAQRHGSVNQGYFPIKETSNMHPDLVEGWVFCRRAFDMEDRQSCLSGGRTDKIVCPPHDFWPLPEYEAFFRQIVRAH